MPVKHALLALLAERDLTGYELKTRFERVLGEFWQLNSGQVYSTLERMRREGLICPRRDGGGPGCSELAPMPPREASGAPSSTHEHPPEWRNQPAPSAVDRRHYTILPRGRRELERWLAAPVPRLRPVRDPLYVKLVFVPAERAASMVVDLGAEVRRYREAVETLDALVARTPLSHVGRTRWLVAEAARLTYAAQLAWLERARSLLAAGSAASPAPAAEPPRRLPGLMPSSRRPPARVAFGRPAVVKPAS